MAGSGAVAGVFVGRAVIAGAGVVTGVFVERVVFGGFGVVAGVLVGLVFNGVCAAAVGAGVELWAIHWIKRKTVITTTAIKALVTTTMNAHPQPGNIFESFDGGGAVLMSGRSRMKLRRSVSVQRPCLRPAHGPGNSTR